MGKHGRRRASAILGIIIGGISGSGYVVAQSPDPPAESSARKPAAAAASKSKGAVPNSPSPSHRPEADAPGARPGKTPAWVHDARWYQLDVPLFRNGEPSNDPPGCAAWTARAVSSKDPAKAAGAATGGDAARPGESPHYGGDLQGLKSKLGYLRRLGINTLYLTSLFKRSSSGDGVEIDMRHVDDSLGIANSLKRITGETSDPATWKFSKTDRLFLDLLKNAHDRGFRVIVEGSFPEFTGPAPLRHDLVDHTRAVARRWMDPNNDGDPADGVDGWHGEPVAGVQLAKWRREIHGINPNAVLVGESRKDTAAAKGFDVVIAHDAGEEIRKFFDKTTVPGAAEKLLDRLARLRKRYADANVAVVTCSGCPRCGRLLSASREGSGKPGKPAISRWRLATAFQHFCFGSPITFQGDEVGMYGRTATRAPMWWNDLTDPKSRTPDYRGDFLALVRLLNAQRDQYASLRRGEFRKVPLDKKQSVLAFARSVSDETAVVVMNFGNSDRHVKLAVARPGQLARIMQPQLEPQFPRRRGAPKPGAYDHTRIARLRIIGSTQYATDKGEVSVWLAPESVTVVLLGNDS